MAKTIMITGAGTGFGKGAAFALARRGHRVLAATYDQAQADALTAEATGAGVALTALPLDITKPTDRQKVTGSGIDVLINNAAVGESGALAEVPLDRIRRTLETNVIPIPFLAPYGMTKFALEVAGADLAVELKPFYVQILRGLGG